MEKGVTGHLMATILVIITGIIAVILFFVFSTKAGEAIQQGFSQLRERFTQTICDMMPWFVKWIMGC